MAKRGRSLVDDIFNRIKEIERIKADTDLAPILVCGRLQPGQWRSREIVPWERVIAYAREREVSLEWLVNGNGPQRRADLMMATREPGAIYRVTTDQDFIFDLAADLAKADGHLSREKFKRILRMLQREYLDTGKAPPAAKIEELVKMAS